MEKGGRGEVSHSGIAGPPVSHCSLASRTVLRGPAVVTFAIGEGADVILACSCAAFGAPFFVN